MTEVCSALLCARLPFMQILASFSCRVPCSQGSGLWDHGLSLNPGWGAGDSGCLTLFALQFHCLKIRTL